MPLAHPAGHAQCDFGQAWAVIGSERRRIHYFVLSLPHSDGIFVKAYPGETTEAFCDGHVSAFRFLGGVPQSVLYDNTKLAVAKILGGGRRKRTRAFTELQSHYLFTDRFGRVGKGNDKGSVEGMVGYGRRNFLVPVPAFDSFDELNAYLEGKCLERMDARLRGHKESIGERMERVISLRCCRCPRFPTTRAKMAYLHYRSQFTVSGPIPHQRLLGARCIRTQGRAGERL